MGEFKATEAVDTLAYDLRPYVDDHGVTPEPSDGQISTFMNALSLLGGLETCRHWTTCLRRRQSRKHKTC